jgi:hypothetical protein
MPYEFPTDHCIAECQERFVDVGASLISDSNSAELMGPSDLPFADPSHPAQAVAMLLSTIGQSRLKTSSPKRGSMRLGFNGETANLLDVTAIAASVRQQAIARKIAPTLFIRLDMSMDSRSRWYGVSRRSRRVLGFGQGIVASAAATAAG